MTEKEKHKARWVPNIAILMGQFKCVPGTQPESVTKPGIYQKIDGTVYWKHEDGKWKYLSPLSGEWLDVWNQPDDEKLKKYPRNLEVLKIDE